MIPYLISTSVHRSRDDVNADSIKRVLERQQRARNTASMFASVQDDGVSRDEDGAAAADSQDIRRSDQNDKNNV